MFCAFYCHVDQPRIWRCYGRNEQRSNPLRGMRRVVRREFETGSQWAPKPRAGGGRFSVFWASRTVAFGARETRRQNRFLRYQPHESIAWVWGGQIGRQPVRRVHETRTAFEGCTKLPKDARRSRRLQPVCACARRVANGKRGGATLPIRVTVTRCTSPIIAPVIGAQR